MDIQNYSFGISPTMTENRAVFQSSMHKGIWLQCTKKNALKKKYPRFLWKADCINGFIHVIAEEWRIDLAAPDLCLRRLLFEREKISVSVTSAYWALSCLSDLVQSYCGHDKSSFDKFWDVFFFLALVTRVVREYKHITRAEVHYTKQGQ